MPELPEVETIKNGLSPYIIGKKVVVAHTNRLKMRIEAPKDSKNLLEDQIIKDIERRSKYLYIHLSSQKTLVIHLGMSGNLTLKPLKTKHIKHDHLVLDLEGTSLHFNDARRFGFYDIQDTSALNDLTYIKNLGIEPLSKSFTENCLKKIMRNSKRPIKTLIMDNKLVVGIGNIYACEALFSANINPFTKSNSINEKCIPKLYSAIITILKDAIISGGSSLKDHKQADGTLGYFQHNFKVYGREGENCYSCKRKILREKQSGRSSFFCPFCQPKS